ncbi:hypothetical protein LTR28_013850, partial [Elasticomyces elasticus]
TATTQVIADAQCLTVSGRYGEHPLHLPLSPCPRKGPLSECGRLAWLGRLARCTVASEGRNDGLRARVGSAETVAVRMWTMGQVRTPTWSQECIIMFKPLSSPPNGRIGQ